MDIEHYRIIYTRGNEEIGYGMHMSSRTFDTYEEAEKVLLRTGYVPVGKLFFATPKCYKPLIENPKAEIDAVLSNGFYKSHWDTIQKNK